MVYCGTGQEEFGKSKATYLAHFAEKDRFEEKSSVDRLEKLLASAGRPAKVYAYPGVDHWFAEPSVNDAFRRWAAWLRTLTFLRKALA